jgi:hypothetical protein
VLDGVGFLQPLRLRTLGILSFRTHMDSGSAKHGHDDPAQHADMVELKTFSDASSAELAKANLEAHGIECRLTADDCGGMYPNLTVAGGVRLLVRASTAEASLALLNTQVSPAEIKQIETEAVTFATPKSAPSRKLSVGQIISGMIVGVILCLLYQWTNRFGTKTYRYDRNLDGKPDEVWVYRNGRPVEWSYDRNFDGKFDSWDHYDSAGMRVLSKADNNFDGIPDVTWRYTKGIITAMEMDTDFNGISDAFFTYKNELVQQVDIKPNGTNVVTVREFLKNGVIVEVWRDTNRDGQFDEIVQYDPFFEPVKTNSFRSLLPAVQ